jgi:acid phosphatase type 7
MKTRRRLALLLLVLTLAGVAVAYSGRLTPGLLRAAFGAGKGAFQVKPYLQPGDPSNAGQDGKESLTLLWQSADRADVDAWAVEVRAEPDGPWREAAPPSSRRVAVDGVPPFRLYRAALTGLSPGAEFAYRVRLGGAVVFEARGSARKAAGRPHRFVVFGDGGADTWAQTAVAYQTFRAQPDYVVVTGDVVYMRGRASDYLNHFFHVYNADEPSPVKGAPLLRSTLFLAAPGNHDLIDRDLDRFPDGLAFFYYWAPPSNGPAVAAGAEGTPTLRGSEKHRRAFLDAAGPAYPRMANYSIDYGDAHWTVLDTNTYADWTAPAFRDWLDADLASAQHAAWRFVAFHHPPFHSSKAHADDQRMRLLAPAFEKGKVAVVFTGHVHNYQRSRPLRFVAGPPPADGGGKAYGPTGVVEGRLTIDTAYDGGSRTEPSGVIYIVSGGGGAKLYNTDQNDDPKSWRDYTARFVSNVHSLTVADVTPESLTIRQVSDEGTELDRFVITRPVDPKTE